jgi:acyl carrier protein
VTSTTPSSFLTDALKAEIKEAVCDILEVEPEELTETASFKDDFNIDSLTAIEIVAVLEKRLGVTIQEEQARLIVDLAGVYDVVEAAARA